VQLQLVTGLFPPHAALHVQPVNVDCDVLNVLRRDPGPAECVKAQSEQPDGG
jgi:hypothetical protein